MILLLLLLVVLVAMAGAGLLGVGVLSDDRRQGRSGWLAALSAPLILVAGIAVLALLVLGVVGLDGPGGDDGPETPGAAAPRPTTTLLPRSRIQVPPADVPVVRIRADDDDRFSTNAVVSGLVPGSVVRVLADGFEWSGRGQVEQCVTEVGRLTACAEAFPVQFGEGRADFQFAVRGDVAPGGCRVGQPTCLLRVTGPVSHRVGTAQTVLTDQLVPGRVLVEPDRGLTKGQAVEVSVTGFPAGTTATPVLCAPPDAYDALRCSPAEPASTFAVDASGSGRTTLTVTGAPCGPRRPCGVTVVVGPGFLAAPVAPVTVSSGPGVDYDAGRLVTGLLVAAALAAVAIGIAVRTDWTKPSEAATPAMDLADLRSGRTLDELFGTNEELDARDPIPW